MKSTPAFPQSVGPSLYLIGLSPSRGIPHTHDWEARPPSTGWGTTRFQCRHCLAWGRRRSTRRGWRGELVVENEHRDAEPAATDEDGPIWRMCP